MPETARYGVNHCEVSSRSMLNEFLMGDIKINMILKVKYGNIQWEPMIFAEEYRILANGKRTRHEDMKKSPRRIINSHIVGRRPSNSF